MSKRQWSDEEKATALAVLDSCGGDSQEACRQLKAAGLEVPSGTLRDWAKSKGVHPVVAEIRERKKGELHQKLEEVAHRLVDAALDKDLESVSAVQLLTGAGIAIDKSQLLQGKATSISVTREERIHRIGELLKLQAGDAGGSERRRVSGAAGASRSDSAESA